MATVGGDVLNFVVKHPTLGSATFYIKSGETSMFDTGGFRSNDDDNGVDGGGEPIWEMTQGRWGVEVVVRNNMNGPKEMEFLSALAADVDDGECIFSHVNSSTYAGTGRPVGKIQADGKTSQIKVKMAGGGELAQV